MPLLTTYFSFLNIRWRGEGESEKKRWNVKRKKQKDENKWRESWKKTEWSERRNWGLISFICYWFTDCRNKQFIIAYVKKMFLNIKMLWSSSQFQKLTQKMYLRFKLFCNNFAFVLKANCSPSYNIKRFYTISNRTRKGRLNRYTQSEQLDILRPIEHILVEICFFINYCQFLIYCKLHKHSMLCLNWKCTHILKALSHCDGNCK